MTDDMLINKIKKFATIIKLNIDNGDLQIADFQGDAR